MTDSHSIHAFLILLLTVLLGAGAAQPSEVAAKAEEAEPQLITAFKREPFKYYTGEMYEFRRRSAAPANLAESRDGGDLEDEIGLIEPRYRRRAKRSKPQQSAVMELLVVVDHGLYLAHMNRILYAKSKQSVKTYYEYFVGYINKIFENALPNSSITVVPAGIAVMKKKNERDWSERNRVPVEGRDYILADKALKQFQIWLERHRKQLPPFDHALALTQYLTGIKVGDIVQEIKGIALLGQMCQVNNRRIKSVSLVHDAGTLTGALTAVHEIAHSIGVNHDGEKESIMCPDNDQFVMSATLAMSETATTFSNCSQRMLQRFLESENAACLFHTADRTGRRLVETNVLPGQIYSKDFQCQRQAKDFKEPRFCKLPWLTPTTLEMSCSSLYCQDGANPTSFKCAASAPAIMGTPCGNRMICLNSRCTFSPSAPCCPLEVEDTGACNRMQQMGFGCQHKLMKLYCCRFCKHTCDTS